jgi:type 2 lantibiotic biosynthesis protein LanM
MAMYPFNEKVAFNQWLDTNNLTYDQFLEWFDRENTSNNSMEDCPWMDYLMCSYEATDNVADKYTNKFGVLIDFMLEKAISDLKNKLINKNVNINFQLLLNIFIKELSESLINMIAPTLTLELYLARISIKLSGNNTEERYESYIQKLSDKEYIYSLFTEYPVLLKRLKNKIEYSASEIHEVYSHLVNDYHALCDTFGNLGQFKGFLNKRGDSHNQGRFVRICQFESKSIVYKPRSLRIDVAFQDLLIDLNKCTGVDFKTYTNIDKITYGWSEFIESKSCKNKEELCQYYINLGNYLMLMYVLNSSDFHFENIISVSKHPIPIDLETILHANASYDGACDTNIDQHTVLDSLILPQKIKFSHNDEYVDYSVLGFNNELLVNDKIGVANDLKRDDIKYKAIIKKVNKSKSNKTVNAKYELNDQDISNYLCQGFESLYHFFQNNKNWLVDNENFQKLSHQSYRFICRSTNTYISLIRSSYHPDYLRNENDLKLYLQQR